MRPFWDQLQARRIMKKKLPVGDTDGPEDQSVRTPRLEDSERGALLR